jgi:putative membrane protein
MDTQEEKNKLKREKVLVRDHLAGYRTDLANRRTFLSYFRTALAFMGGGLALIKFSSDPMFVAIGIVLIPGGIVVLVQGFALFRRMRMVILEEEKISDSEIE